MATIMVVLTVACHGAGLIGLSRLMRAEHHGEAAAHLLPTSPRGAMFTLFLVLGLFALHGVEIWLYAALYLGLGLMPDLHTSVYFSTITYSTIGYQDYGIDSDWRLVAAIEGINGVILLGWSTAFFVSVLSRLARR